jgi:hypothetical protein
MARDVLPIPGTEVPSESAFSSARQTLTFTRSLLAPESLEALMVSKYYLRKKVKDLRTLQKLDDETLKILLSEVGLSDAYSLLEYE